MKVLIRQFLGKNHSWSVCGWGWAEALINLGHDVHLFSTDGIKHLPEKLKTNLVGYVEENDHKVIGRVPNPIYDMQISYTSMKNFFGYLGNGNKNRFGWWVYEWNGKNVLPEGFAKSYLACDVLFSPSNFGKDIYVNSGIPADKVQVVPHGINIENYKKTSTINLKTNKKFKIFANIAQLHLRKNIPGLLEAYGKAFTKKDDVVLVLKCKEKPRTYPFEISFSECMANFKKKFPNHAEIRVFSEFVDDMSDLYRSVDVVYTMSFCEGYYVPGLEGLAAGKLNIAPRYGGQLDFLNDDNSYLVDGEIVRADPKSMYWESKPNAVWFQPSTDDAATKLQLAYKNHILVNEKLELQKHIIHNTYSWENVVNQMMKFIK